MAEIEIRKLSKSFEKGTVAAVKEVSFDVEKGELFGLIGPDGAGKTTIFHMLTTLILPDRGEASVCGLDIVRDYAEIRKRVGYMPGRFSLYQDLTIEENLGFFATVFNTKLEENYELIKDIYVQIEPFKKRRAGKLSGGMKQKLALCCAMIHKPEVLFLDEPTTGVDVVSRKEFWEMLKKLKSQGITILVSTPYMDEAKLCDRIALMHTGEIMSIDSPTNIIQRFPKPLFAAKASEIYKLLKAMNTEPTVESCYAFGEYLHFTLLSDDETEQQIDKLGQKFGMAGFEARQVEATIEDSFIRLMQEKARKEVIHHG